MCCCLVCGLPQKDSANGCMNVTVMLNVVRCPNSPDLTTKEDEMNRDKLKQLAEDAEALENISPARFGEYKAACQKFLIDAFNCREDLKNLLAYVERLEGALGKIARREDNVLIQPHDVAKQALAGSEDNE